TNLPHSLPTSSQILTRKRHRAGVGTILKGVRRVARKTGELMGLARFAKSAAVAAVLSAIGASAALAATFDGIFSLSGSSFAEPGLVMQTSAQTGAMTFQLDTVGQSITLDL